MSRFESRREPPTSAGYIGCGTVGQPTSSNIEERVSRSGQGFALECGYVDDGVLRATTAVPVRVDVLPVRVAISRSRSDCRAELLALSHRVRSAKRLQNTRGIFGRQTLYMAIRLNAMVPTRTLSELPPISEVALHQLRVDSGLRQLHSGKPQLLLISSLSSQRSSRMRAPRRHMSCASIPPRVRTPRKGIPLNRSRQINAHFDPRKSQRARCSSPLILDWGR